MLKEYAVMKIIAPADDSEIQLADDNIGTTVTNIEKRDQRPYADGHGPSAVEMIRQRRAAEAARSAYRRQMEVEVGQAGILGVLSTGGSSGNGSAIIDALTGSGMSGTRLEDALSGVNGLATAGEGSQVTTVLGPRQSGRIVGTAEVEELLSGVGSVGSISIGRKGRINIALESARVSGKGTRSVFRSSEEISRVINEHTMAIEYCFKRESKLDPGLSGDILVEFVIGSRGVVKSVRVLKSSLGNRAMESCIIDRIRGWRFKPMDSSEGDVTVRQKYIFD